MGSNMVEGGREGWIHGETAVDHSPLRITQHNEFPSE